MNQINKVYLILETIFVSVVFFITSIAIFNIFQKPNPSNSFGTEASLMFIAFSILPIFFILNLIVLSVNNFKNLYYKYNSLISVIIYLVGIIASFIQYIIISHKTKNDFFYYFNNFLNEYIFQIIVYSIFYSILIFAFVLVVKLINMRISNKTVYSLNRIIFLVICFLSITAILIPKIPLFIVLSVISINLLSLLPISLIEIYLISKNLNLVKIKD
jgi:hypothetical protein